MKKTYFLSAILFSLIIFMFSCKLNSEPEVVTLNISSFPDTMSFYQNDVLDLTGLEVQAVYSDGRLQTVEDFTTEPAENSLLTKTGKQKITVKALNTSVNFKITVLENSVSSLSVYSYPNKQIYKVGESLSLEGLILLAKYTNGTQKFLSAKDVTSNPQEGTVLNTIELKEIKLQYQNNEENIQVNVQEKDPEYAETPIIIEQTKVVRKFVNETTKISVDIKDVNEGVITYQWYKGISKNEDFSILENETSNYLMIENSGDEEQYFYYVKIKHFVDGKITTEKDSDYITVIFNEAIKLISQTDEMNFDLYSDENELPELSSTFRFALNDDFCVRWFLHDEETQEDSLLQSENISVLSDEPVTLGFKYKIKQSDFAHEITSKYFYCDITENDETLITSNKIKVSQTTTGDLAPFPYQKENTSANMDFLFNLDTLGITTINITRAEWNTMLTNFDTFAKNEVNVHADYAYEKDGYNWKAYNSGIRIRGNTSRVRPQTTDGKYTQAHFQVDFEEFTEDKYDAKIAGCMKSVTLKRFKYDPTYAREIYGYDFLRHYGIWTAPRSCYTRLLINIYDEETNKTENIDYGIYQMIEHVNKQYLKDRSKGTSTSQINNNLTGGDFSSNSGYLWKCWRAFLSTEQKAKYGIENVTLDPKSFVWYNYSLKTEKENFDSGKQQLSSFITKLASIYDTTPDFTEAENSIDIDFLIKTKAILVLLGDNDDYWKSGNNYYLYNDVNGTFYFIPYDLDHILYNNNAKLNPFKRTLLHTDITSQRPLIDLIINNETYKQKYIDYLNYLINEESYFSPKESKARIQKWQELISPYVASPDLYYKDTYESIDDFWYKEESTTTRLLSDDSKTNYFQIRINTINNSINKN